ncbi:hypothetical protein HN51_040399 [Arachis hypogaea]
MGVSSTCSTKLALWYKILELRFLLQKPFSSSNRLPQDPVKFSFCEADGNVRVAYSDLITSSNETLDSILELQELHNIGQSSTHHVHDNTLTAAVIFDEIPEDDKEVFLTGATSKLGR